MSEPDFLNVVDLSYFFEIANHFDQAHQLEVGGRRSGFSFSHAVDHEGLETFLFGVEVSDEAGLTEFDGAKDDGTGGVDHAMKIRLRLRLRRRIR